MVMVETPDYATPGLFRGRERNQRVNQGALPWMALVAMMVRLCEGDGVSELAHLAWHFALRAVWMNYIEDRKEKQKMTAEREPTPIVPEARHAAVARSPIRR